MVHRARFDDSDQRCDGIHIWILFRQNTSHQVIAKEDLGRLHRRWSGHRCSRHGCKCAILPVLKYNAKSILQL